MVIKHKDKDLSKLVGKITWSGSRLQVARRLVFEYVQDIRDTNLPNYPINIGETVQGYDENKTLLFQGNVFDVEKDMQSSKVTITAYDNLFILCKSKTTRKFVDMTPEAITAAICAEMGVKTGNILAAGINVSFIASRKSGYQIIMMAYTEAAKTTGKKYHPVMNGDALDIIEKGTVIEDYEADDLKNIENSRYKESIEEMVNQIMITDEQGNVTGYKTNDEWIKKYSMIQDVYKSSPKENTEENVAAMLKGPERSGSMDLLGDYRVKAPYSIKVKESLFPAQFWIKSDSHTFENGMHFMKVEAEFENLVNEEKISESEKKV